MSFGKVRRIIEEKVKLSLIETEVAISMGKLKSNTIVVGGEVYCPGIHQVNGLSSIIDVLSKSGGLKNTGSLRKIKIYNENKTEKIVDLYGLIFGINPDSIVAEILANGSTIIVPTIGETISISGDVSKPGIYEIISQKTTLGNILDISGGFSLPGGYQTSLYRVDNSGNYKTYNNIDVNTILKNGDSLMVLSTSSILNSKFEVYGSVKTQGSFLNSQYPYLSNFVLGKNLLISDIYKYAIIIASRSSDGVETNYSTFNLKKSFARKG